MSVNVMSQWFYKSIIALLPIACWGKWYLELVSHVRGTWFLGQHWLLFYGAANNLFENLKVFWQYITSFWVSYIRAGFNIESFFSAFQVIG